jgi:hypothetical protein
MAAKEYLAYLAALPPVERTGAVEQMMRRVFDKPQVLHYDIEPEDVIAAAAVVVASLPNGAALARRDMGLAMAILPSPIAVELVMLTLAVIDLVTGRDRDSVPVRLQVTNRAAAHRLIEDLRTALVDGIRHAEQTVEPISSTPWE